ncbi:MAG: InlB B-repeat-containing protein, partial [Firmicutes bacterium]|nr:InlB B-repeat-containing protein [Bacillota bacterium]
MAKHYSKHQVGRKILSLCLALAMFCSSVSAGTPRIFADADPAQVVSAEKDAKPVTEANDAAEPGGATGIEEAVEGDSQGGSGDETDAPVYTVTLKPEDAEEPAAEDEADDTLKSIDEADKTEEGEDGDAALTDGQKTEDENVSETAIADNDDPANAEAGKDGEDKQPEAEDLVPDENKGSEEDGKESDAVSGPALTESGDQTNEDGQDGTDVVDNNEDPAKANAAETVSEELTTPAANADGDVDVQTSEPAVETTPEVIEEETSSEAIEAVTTSDAVEVVTTTDAVEEQTSEPAVEGETSEPAIEEVTSSEAIEDQTSEAAIETSEPAVEELTSSDAIENQTSEGAIETSGEAITSGEAVETTGEAVEATGVAIKPTEPAIKRGQKGPWEYQYSFKQTFKTDDYHGLFKFVGVVWDFLFNHGEKTVFTDMKVLTNFFMEGFLPEGTEATISEYKGELPEAIADNAIMAYDITLDLDGEEVQPDRGKPVTVSISNEMIGEAVDAGSDITVWHINDDGSYSKVNNVVIDGSTITFDAKSFSVYAVIASVTPRLTITFMNGSADGVVAIVKAADTAEEVEKIIYDPGVENLGTKVFKGWTTDEEYTSSSVLKSIAQVRTDAMTSAAAITEDTSITYYAAVYTQYKLDYIDEVGTSQGSETVEIPDWANTNQAQYIVNMGYTPETSEQNFEGWHVAEGKSNIVGYEEGHLYKNGDSVTITGDVTFSVYEPYGRWLVFDENGKGGTYNAPQFVHSGDVTVKPCEDSEMVRFGYTFGGWYENAACTGAQFEFGHELTEGKTIYAKWIAQTRAEYSVLIWLQNISLDGYDFKESVTLEGNVNSTINTVVAQNGTGNNNSYARVNNQNKQYTGFHLVRFDQNVTINTEGTAVVNVYYDRTEYTLTFSR